MTDQELFARVRELRERGSSPKQIARALGMAPSAVAPLVRQIAAAQQAHTDPADRALLGCWINPGWSVGLGLAEASDEWAATDPQAGVEVGPSGLVHVLVARQERASRATVCGFLIDVYCLGVKNAIGPLPMSIGSIDDFRREFFSTLDVSPLVAPLELAQHLVHGSVAYARGLGFEPHPDFGPTAPYLGAPATPTPIQFGRDGKPLYISGPYDDPHAIIRTLESTVGAGNFDVVTHV
ncbi:hypothetical protein [Solwaraspora sp. WMMA2065]|uniref:hypothetical protein n=1 Tax=Solwaraspora sp. WMMA2065 TaxID=3015166 RepID=UPI00259BEF12|nr:hypothetical protein [Solwaraspora sp. WMMA2065]WJK33947.1 hypothetical protein O7610_25410 [Solwaraspora sp. WMMA2065]